MAHKGVSSASALGWNSFSPQIRHKGLSKGTIFARHGSHTGKLAMLMRGARQMRQSEGKTMENRLDEAALTALFITSRNCVVRWGTR